MTSNIGMPNSKSVVKALPTQMSVLPNGNVGIGTTSPYAPLYIEIPQPSSSVPLQISGETTFNNTVVAGFTTTNSAPNNYGLIVGLLNNGTSYLQALSRTHSSYYNLLLNPNGGNVGIGTTGAGSVSIGTTSGLGSHSLRIDGNPTAGGAQIYATGARYGILVNNNGVSSHTFSDYSAYFGGGVVKIHGYYSSSNTGTAGILGSSGASTTSGVAALIGLYVVKAIYSGTNVFTSSDRRIKNNIVDVPDHLALTYLRNIPCCYYNYIDRPNQTNTIGFIAQEVKEVFPIAVTTTTNFIPNIMQTVSGEWIERDDGKYDFSSNFFTDISFGTYKFYLGQNASDARGVEENISMNDDRTFTFEKTHYAVFCYGIEIDDFHIVDKAKLFALNFSATQEIDRIQQQHIIDISNAQATIQQHETTIQQHETTIQQQQLEIENLKLVNQDMNNQLNMIKEHLGL